ncbi:hypothetical protein LP420_38260 [Massilia sp. B-10]|nr:hypothetical protein LP420_38260 [Massilia sp. B-10]
MASDFLSLKPVEQAVLWRLLEQGSRFRAYDADALNFYADSVGERITPGPGAARARFAAQPHARPGMEIGTGRICHRRSHDVPVVFKAKTKGHLATGRA